MVKVKNCPLRSQSIEEKHVNVAVMFLPVAHPPRPLCTQIPRENLSYAAVALVLIPHLPCLFFRLFLFVFISPSRISAHPMCLCLAAAYSGKPLVLASG